MSRLPSPRRVAQPPIDLEHRNSERHRFGPGFAVLLVALALVLYGSVRATGLPTQEDDPARETQLIKAFARGGLEFRTAHVRLDPASLADPTRAAAALDRAARVADLPLRERYRVNTSAVDPCPT